MPSAKMVAQKPAGNLSPLSVSGHAPVADCALLGALCAGIEKLVAHIALSIAIANHEFLFRASHMVRHLSEWTHWTRGETPLWCNLDLKARR
jgi:hypothetical protein